MKLWLLRPVPNLPKDPQENPWFPWFDKVHGFVIRAEDEERARRMAHYNMEREGERLVVGEGYCLFDPPPWLSAKWSICMELTPDTGGEGIIMADVTSS